LNNSNPEDIYQIRRSGLFASASTLIQLFVILFFFIIPLFISSFNSVLQYSAYIFLFAAICAGILQILVLLTGMKSLLSVFRKGKSVLWLSAIALIIAISCIPVSLLFFENSPTWFIFGMIIQPYTLSNETAFHIWFTVINTALAGYNLTFGYILIENDEAYGYGDLTTPGFFLLILGSLQAANAILSNIPFSLSPYEPLNYIKSIITGFSIFISAFVSIVWFLYIGYQFRKLPHKGLGDGWDQFRQKIRDNPSIQTFLARKTLGIIALIASSICTIGVIINSLFSLLPFGYFWWLSATGLVLAFISLKFERPNSYAIAGLVLGSMCWVAGSMLYSWSFHYFSLFL